MCFCLFVIFFFFVIIVVVVVVVVVSRRGCPEYGRSWRRALAALATGRPSGTSGDAIPCDPCDSSCDAGGRGSSGLASGRGRGRTNTPTETLTDRRTFLEDEKKKENILVLLFLF